MRGAVTRSKVKITSGADPPSAFARPSRTTVSPLRTDLILALPRLGRMVTMLLYMECSGDWLRKETMMTDYLRLQVIP